MPKLILNRRYATTPNDVLNNPNLSLKAKGLYGYIQSKPDGWAFSAERIANDSKDGLDSVKAGLQELEQVGYLRRTMGHSEKGHWSFDYELFETPLEALPLQDNPSAGNPLVENPSRDNPHTYSKQEVSKQEVSKKDVIKAKFESSATIEDRMVIFLSMVNLFKGTYPDDMLKAFFDYWSEPNAKGKMRFELQETWETGRRLATWNRNNSKFGPQEQRKILNEAKLSLDEIRRQREASI